jgi:hypothetical protein
MYKLGVKMPIFTAKREPSAYAAPALHTLFRPVRLAW